MLSQKNKRNVFKKRKQLQSFPLSAVSVCCRFYFLYEIFVLYFPSIVASLCAKGWERPSVSGTHLSVTIVQVCLVSRVWPHPNHTTSISLVAHRMPSTCPAGALLVFCPWDSPSQHPQLPGNERLQGQVRGYTGQWGCFLSPGRRSHDPVADRQCHVPSSLWEPAMQPGLLVG